MGRRERGVIRKAALAVLMTLATAPTTGAMSAPRPISTATLSGGVDRVESVRAVKRLQYAFAHEVAAGDWRAAATLFTRDGRLIDGTASEAVGQSAIEAWLRSAVGRGVDGLPLRTLHLQMFMSPIVTLSPVGETAQGRWHMIGMDGASGGTATWSGGIFEIDYRRESGAWRIARQHYHPFLIGDYAEGWHSATAELPMVPYRHDPKRIGIPVSEETRSPRAQSTRDMTGRIARLRAEDAVRNLQNAYGYYVDRKMWDDVVDLFTTTATLEIAGEGSYRGPAGVRRKLLHAGPAGLRWGELNDHIQADLVVDISPDGRQARARGFDLGMIGRNEGKANWSVTEYDNLYVRDGGVWRIERMRQASRMKADYAAGWAKSWLSDPAPPAELAPDGPAPADLPPRWDFAAGYNWKGSKRSAPAFPDQAGALRAAAAYDAIENLAGAYGQYIDDSQWPELAGLFAAQGERDSAGGGFIRTPARIASFSAGRYGRYNPHRTFTSMHIRTQPVIHVADDGRSAQERTRLFQFLIGAADAPPAKYETGMLMTGMYEDDLVFEEGAWRFKRVDIDHLLYTLDYRHGWTRIPEGTGKLLDPALATDVQFDAPGAGDTYPPFPKVGHMWFHYRNPASGRAPAYLMPKYALPEP
jgi:ketosteroid isomerase-like protein